MAQAGLPKTYDFRTVEQRLYRWWEERGYFQPRPGGGTRPFVISMPPPNVTGELHLGHAMFVATEDLMIRYHRMRGETSLWVPGTDHAGIATQLQVEKDLLRTEEVTREELGREKFVERTWQWKEKYGGIITQQLRRLGASCDWSRERFTLEPALSRAVREAFVRLYEKGLIYRGTYLINWSPGLRTAVSDLEVEYHEEQVSLYTFRYPLQGSDEFIPVATTRPETILADTAVAVHPEDERYRAFIGRTALVPILGRPIPVIADARVDREFGTGALKITPGHDATDYEIAQRHDLPILSVLNPDATLNDAAGPYAGMDRFVCREKLWADLKAAGLAIKTEPYLAQIPRSQRGGEIIEPMISTQWFVRMQPLAQPALEVVRSGAVRLVPERFTKVYFNWLENIRDWCISRQLWWGHRIPAWHCADCQGITVGRQDPDRCGHCGSQRIEQDPDVLDTWFSSGLWPFSTLGWPDETEDLRTYYPTSVLETGAEILFFWVARMIMLGLEFTGVAPFHTVYLHGTVRDQFGRRMSKTLGNGINPLWILEGASSDQLPEYARKQYPQGLPAMGADALRFTLLTASTPGKDLSLSLEAVEANRNFANKLWNVGRLVLLALERAPHTVQEESPPTLADQWIEARRRRLIGEFQRLFEAYQFGEAGRGAYEFLWSELADWYLEIAKRQLEEGPARAFPTARTMASMLDTVLRLLHPYTPYVTEELWGHLKAACSPFGAAFAPAGGWEEALIVAQWPEKKPPLNSDGRVLADFARLQQVIGAIRNARAEHGVQPRRRIGAALRAAAFEDLFREQAPVLMALAGIDPAGLTFLSAEEAAPKLATPLVCGGIEVYLPMAGMQDVGEERERLAREQQEVREQIHRLEGLLGGPFAQRAPADVVEKERERLRSLQESDRKLSVQLRTIE